MTDKPKKRFLFRKSHLYLAIAVFLFIGSGFAYFHSKTVFCEVVEGTVYRGRQPNPEELVRLISKYNLKTIINLRGHVGTETAEEVAISEKMNVKHISMHLTAYNVPPSYLLSKLISEIETCAKPVFIHCHNGVDRSGTAAAIAAMAVGGEDYYKAKRQSFVMPGPWKRKRTSKYIHISDLFVKFENYCRENEVVPAWPTFKNWAENVYQFYRYYFFVHYSLPEEVVLAPSESHIVQVGIINSSDMEMPGENSHLQFKLLAYLGEGIDKGSDFQLLGPPTPLPRKNIRSGEEIVLAQKITAPEKPGKYKVNIDILRQKISGDEITFEAKGSPIGGFWLIVTENDTKQQKIGSVKIDALVAATYSA
ncbi:MAG: tyrosine-protein phosphatase [Sedimentisphaerales bacterium]|nr:tyrosine-protein phosphatase [Sedimentisphaerales bacterium]